MCNGCIHVFWSNQYWKKKASHITALKCILWVYPNTCNSGWWWLVKALFKNSNNCLLPVASNRTDPIYSNRMMLLIKTVKRSKRNDADMNEHHGCAFWRLKTMKNSANKRRTMNVLSKRPPVATLQIWRTNHLKQHRSMALQRLWLLLVALPDFKNPQRLRMAQTAQASNWIIKIESWRPFYKCLNSNFLGDRRMENFMHKASSRNVLRAGLLFSGRDVTCQVSVDSLCREFLRSHGWSPWGFRAANIAGTNDWDLQRM